MEPSTSNNDTNRNGIHSNRRIDADVAIVGGGLAGLIAAAYVARAGRRVVLIERQTPGGRARSTTTSTGFICNQGPHALYVDQALHSALADLGIDVRGTAPDVVGARGLLDDKLGLLPGGVGSLIRTGLLPARAKPQLARLLATIGRKNPSDYAHLTVEEWFEKEGLHPEVRRLVASIVRLTTYCVDHDIASADMAVGQVHLGLSSGVLYLHDGWQQMVDSLSQKATELGVTLQTGTAVRSVDGATVTLADDTVVSADAVIIAGLSPEAVQGIVPNAPDLRTMAGPAVEAASLDVGVRSEPDVSIVLGLDEPLYYSRHDPPAALAPPGHRLYSAMRYLASGEQHDRHTTRNQLEQLAFRAGVSPDDIVESRYSHRLTVAEGLPLASNGGLPGRPGIDALGLPGVFLAGDWIGPDGVLADAAAASAIRAAAAAVAGSSPAANDRAAK